MRLFGKKKRGTPPLCCSRTPETMVRVGADKIAAGVKVLGSGCARYSAPEAAAHTALTGLGMSVIIEHVTDFMQIAAYGAIVTPALVVGGRVVSRGRVPDQVKLREMLQEALRKETLEQGPMV